MHSQGMEFFLRWFHYIFGVMWIGLLWYFNFVQGAFMKAAAPETKADANKHLVPRALAYFRWAALLTWLVGVGLMVNKNYFDFGFRGNHPIQVGALLGTLMFLNVWSFIWQNQKKVLGLKEATPEEKTKAARIAFLASRSNTLMSIPMLFFMAAQTHGQFLFGP